MIIKPRRKKNYSNNEQTLNIRSETSNSNNVKRNTIWNQSINNTNFIGIDLNMAYKKTREERKQNPY